MSDDVFALADFETPVPSETIPPLKWSVQKYTVAQMIALHGKSKRAISLETKVPLNTINNWLAHPDFQAYIKQTLEQAAATMKNDSISLLTKIISARVAEAEVSGDYASLSKKDTLDIVKELNALTEDDNKKEESTYTKLLEKLIGNSSKVVELQSQTQKE